jgi:cytochrome c biogenesis protein CcmG/thiol:disulfide interchange protein DsbE
MAKDETRKKGSKVLFLVPLVFAGISAMFVYGMNRENPDELPSTRIGREAPKLMLTQLGDLPMFTNEDLKKGGVKLVNFWASWCVGCRIEHPVLVEMSKKGEYPIYGVDYKDDKGLQYLTEKENPYVAVAEDKVGRTAIEWGVYGIPETFVVDANGMVTHRHIGAITPEVMENVIMPEIAKAEKGAGAPGGES